MSKFPHGGEVLGASPANPLLAPVLRPEMVLSRQQALLDLQAIQRIPGLAGYWPADPAYLYQDSAGYIPATVGGVVGQVRDISNAATPVARRNLLTYSEQFDNAAWYKSLVSITPNAITAPDGTLTADKLIDTTGTGFHYAEQTGLITTNQTYTYSLYVKGGETSTFRCYVVHVGASSDTSEVVFSVTDGVITLLTFTINAILIASSIRITSDREGFYRIQFAYTLSGTVTSHRFRIHAKQAASYTGDGTSGLYIWGAQLEVGGEATPYQKIVTGTGDVFAPGNHAYQQTTAKKPYLRKTPQSGVYWLDSNTSTSALTATLGNLGSACTVAQAGAEGVAFTENVTISSTYNIAPAYGFNGDVAIFNRALTASEKALLTRYIRRGVPVLGANLIVNGTFDIDTSGWITDDATVNVVNGAAEVTTTGDYGRLVSGSLNLKVNNYYILLGDILYKSNTGRASTIGISVSSNGGGGGLPTAIAYVPTNNLQCAFKASSVNTYAVCGYSFNDTGTVTKYDNIRMMEIL